jgi:hypothetical protein
MHRRSLAGCFRARRVLALDLQRAMGVKWPSIVAVMLLGNCKSDVARQARPAVSTSARHTSTSLNPPRIVQAGSPGHPDTVESATKWNDTLFSPRPPELVEVRRLVELARTDAGTRRNVPVIITPGVQEERAITAALAYLQSKQVQVARFSHARALLKGNTWEVVLLEMVGGPRFGRFEHWVTLENGSFRILHWKQMQ